MTKLTEKQMFEIANKADTAGKVAAEAHNPTPMIVQQHKSMVDDTSPVIKEYFVPDGVCGFAEVRVRPGNSRFANFMKKQMGARKAYYGGISLWISDYGQSMELKQAYANAYAGVLQENGIDAWSESRMD